MKVEPSPHESLDHVTHAGTAELIDRCANREQPFDAPTLRLACKDRAFDDIAKARRREEGFPLKRVSRQRTH